MICSFFIKHYRLIPHIYKSCQSEGKARTFLSNHSLSHVALTIITIIITKAITFPWLLITSIRSLPQQQHHFATWTTPPQKLAAKPSLSNRLWNVLLPNQGDEVGNILVKFRLPLCCRSNRRVLTIFIRRCLRREKWDGFLESSSSRTTTNYPQCQVWAFL